MHIGKALAQGNSDDIVLEEPSVSEPEKAESSSVPTAKGRRKGAKSQSEGQARKAATPRTQTKKAKKAAAASAVAATSLPPAAEAVAPSPAAPETVAHVATATGAAPATGKDTASDAIGRMSQLSLSTSQRQAEQRLPTNAGSSSEAPPTSTPVLPPSPKTKGELPATIFDLESLLPKCDAPPLDTVDPELDENIAAHFVALTPNFTKYISDNILVIKTHRQSINKHDHSVLWTQLQNRETVLEWYDKYYALLGPLYRKARQPEADPDFGPFNDCMDVDLPAVALPSK
jgi:hypothetical protein